MKVEYYNEYSPNLGRHMELKVYGHAGKPILVFPSQCGRFYEYEGFGMIDVASGFIEEGKAQFFCVDGLDWETFVNSGWPGDRLHRFEQYFNYVCEEVVPWALDINAMGSHFRAGGMMATGCSMGALHSANFFFRRPDLFDAVIAQSGLYSCRSFFGDDCAEDGIYFNSPMEYLPNLNDKELLHRYRHSQIILSVGQGAWENECLHDTHVMDDILRAKNIPAWVDYWGHDVPHDWPAWRVQLPYFLGHVL